MVLRETTTVAETIGYGCKPETLSPLEDDTILPEQFFTRLRTDAPGERLLLAAVLKDAIDCFRKGLSSSTRDRRLFREAEQWITETGCNEQGADTQPYFSFEWVCEVLALDYDHVRDQLSRWLQRQLASGHRATAPAVQLPRSRRLGTKRRRRGTLAA